VKVAILQGQTCSNSLLLLFLCPFLPVFLEGRHTSLSLSGQGYCYLSLPSAVPRSPLGSTSLVPALTAAAQSSSRCAHDVKTEKRKLMK
jgi:hypothetical protein